MKVPPVLVLLAVASITGSLLFAAESPQTTKTTPEKSVETPAPATPPVAKVPDKAPEGPAGKIGDSPAEKTDQKTADQAADKAAEKPAAEKGAATAKSAADRAASPQRFVPSEEVRADFDVSFPIDI